MLRRQMGFCSLRKGKVFAMLSRFLSSHFPLLMSAPTISRFVVVFGFLTLELAFDSTALVGEYATFRRPFNSNG